MKRRDRKRLEQEVHQMDREYGAAQLGLLAQLLMKQGRNPHGAEEADQLRRVGMRIVAWGVSHDDPMRRASDHSFWMFACDKHGEDVLRWDQELSSLATVEERHAATERFRARYEAEFNTWLVLEKARQTSVQRNP